jgi:putative nucleotidyltransferase with HDIG domain
MSLLEQNLVSAGSYYVGKSSPLLLKAYLGTCVGVAVFDKINGVGGMVHLLLDKPPVSTANFQPEKYASTGLPIFLQKLIDSGASREKMCCWVAGGALVGPLEEGDLFYDIGGQTTESVMAFLHAHRISIKRSETGGFFTCALKLDMQAGECIIEPVMYENHGPEMKASVSTADKINSSINNLRPIPQVALKILRLINEDIYDIALLGDEVRKDQILSARTIKLCNSAFFKKSNKIESMDHALVYLGQKNLMKFIISAAIRAFFSQAGMGYSLCKGGMYHHAVGTAIIAEKIAEFTGKADMALAYTAGLLHDVGKVVLDQFIENALPLFYRQLFEEETNSCSAENRIFGINHTDAGKMLAEQWSFPESLSESVEYHHTPEDARVHKELVHIVFLADLLMSRFHVGLELERLNTSMLNDRLEVLDLSIGGFTEIVDLIPLEALEHSLQEEVDE